MDRPGESDTPAPTGSGDRASWPALELFSGIGGFAVASAGIARTVAAIDIDRVALEIYARHLPGRTVTATIESLRDRDLYPGEASLWWLSPPCQPFTRRGRQRDLEDPRSRAFQHVVGRIRHLQPKFLAMENVPEFGTSRAHALLRDALADSLFHVHEFTFCPSEFGIPNRRKRFYLLAGRERLVSLPGPPRIDRSLASYLEPDVDASYRVPDEWLRDYADAMHIVDPRESRAVSRCFTSAYGRSPVHSGSYIREPDGSVRFFTPHEILAVLGFPPTFRFPDDQGELSTRRRWWSLAGNSLSVPVVSHVLQSLPPCREATARIPAIDAQERA